MKRRRVCDNPEFLGLGGGLALVVYTTKAVRQLEDILSLPAAQDLHVTICNRLVHLLLELISKTSLLEFTE